MVSNCTFVTNNARQARCCDSECFCWAVAELTMRAQNVHVSMLLFFFCCFVYLFMQQQLIDDNTKNPALDHLLKIMNKNQLNFTNARTLEKVEKILQSQKTVVTEVWICVF